MYCAQGKYSVLSYAHVSSEGTANTDSHTNNVSKPVICKLSKTQYTFHQFQVCVCIIHRDFSFF